MRPQPVPSSVPSADAVPSADDVLSFNPDGIVGATGTIGMNDDLVYLQSQVQQQALMYGNMIAQQQQQQQLQQQLLVAQQMQQQHRQQQLLLAQQQQQQMTAMMLQARQQQQQQQQQQMMVAAGMAAGMAGMNPTAVAAMASGEYNNIAAASMAASAASLPSTVVGGSQQLPLAATAAGVAKPAAVEQTQQSPPLLFTDVGGVGRIYNATNILSPNEQNEPDRLGYGSILPETVVSFRQNQMNGNQTQNRNRSSNKKKSFSSSKSSSAARKKNVTIGAHDDQFEDAEDSIDDVGRRDFDNIHDKFEDADSVGDKAEEGRGGGAKTPFKTPTAAAASRAPHELDDDEKDIMKSPNIANYKFTKTTGHDSNWLESYEQFKAYKKEHGNCNVHQSLRKLWHWVRYQRLCFLKGTLRNDRIDMLDKIDFDWGSKIVDSQNDEEKWLEMYEKLKEFNAENQQKLKKLPSQQQPQSFNSNHMTPQTQQSQWEVIDEKLGAWMSYQRLCFSKGKLSEERKKLLDEVGFVWNVQILPVVNNNAPWMEQYNKLKAYKSKHGHCNASRKVGRLGRWVGTQRKLYSKGTLLEDRLHLLEKIGFVWNYDDAQWNENFANLSKFKEEHGHCNVAQTKKRAEEAKLGSWSKKQRQCYKAGTLRRDREALLTKLGFHFS